MNLDKSHKLFQRAKNVIPGQSQTFSKGPTQFVGTISPHYCSRAKGAIIWDVDENQYTDYMMALGPIILGYCDDEVDGAVIEQVKKGSIFSLSHKIEVECAEKISGLIPSAEMVRFGKNGSDVTTAAVRISRAYTGKDKVACCGYHGWQDWYIGSTTRNKGIPNETRRLTLPFEYNNIDSLKSIFDQYSGEIACVIIEAIGLDTPDKNFLNEVKALAHKNNAILIFDEMKTGCRLALGGVEEYTGVMPDLSTWGKAVANGYPLSFISGKKELMQEIDNTFFSFTFGGEAVSIAACVKTLELIQKRQTISHIDQLGQSLKLQFDQCIQHHKLEKYIENKGLSTHFVTVFNGTSEFKGIELKSLLHQELVKRQQLTIGSYMLCGGHSNEHISNFIKQLDDSLKVVSTAIANGRVVESIEGKPVEVIF